MTRIAILRPHQTLSQYEMDYVGLLRDEFDVEAITVGPSAIGSDGVEATRVRWPDEFVSGGTSRSLMNAFYARVLGRRYHIPGLERLLGGVDIVQAGEAASESSYQAALLKPRHGFRLLLSASENQPIFEGKTWSQRKRIELVLSRADHAFCIPREAEERLIEAGFDEEKITVIGHGIDCERFSPPKETSAREFRAGFCGRFRKEKGLPILIEAASRSGVRLRLLGEGPDEEALRAIASDAVEFLPALPYGEIHTFYREIDVFVLPSIPTPGLVEQFGFVLMEAMASGVPVIASSIGGIPRVLGGAGILVPPGDVDALAEKLSLVKSDASLRARLAAAGRERALKFYRREDVANRMRSVYRKL